MSTPGNRRSVAGASAKAAKPTGGGESASGWSQRWPRATLWTARALLVAATVAAYSNTLRSPFVFDDKSDIVDNRSIRRLWPLWRPLLADSPQETSLRARPVVNLSLAINYATGELDTLHYHLTNLAVHLLAGLVLFGLVRRTLSLPGLSDRFGQAATLLAFVTAGVWLLHPLQTQAVTYIIQRYESMMGLFYLLSLYCALRSDGSGRARWWEAGSVAACLLAMGCKEVAVSAPLMILIYDRAFLAGSFREAWRRRRGMYLGLAATWVALAAILALSSGSRGRWAGFGLPTSPLDYAKTQLGVILHYLRLSFWPHPQVFDYGWPVARTAREILPGLFVVVGLLAASVWALVRWPRWGAVGAWFFLILAPTSSIMPIADRAFEHRMYLSLASVVTAVVIGGYTLAGRLLAGPRGSASGKRRALLLPALAVMAALGVATYARNQLYESECSLWSDVIRKAPANLRAYNALVLALGQQGRLDEAVSLCQRALQVDPQSAHVPNTLGMVLLQWGRVDEAIPWYRKALEIDPESALAHNNLAIALSQRRQFDEAIAECHRALELDPQSSLALLNLGIVLERQGKVEEALAQYRRALEIDPDFPDVHINLGAILQRQGKPDEAMVHYRKALDVDPRADQAHFNLASLLSAQGKTTEAASHYRRAVKANPRNSGAHCSLAATLAGAGQLDQAIVHYQKALQLDPTLAEARYQLGRIFYLQGEAGEAVAQWRETLRLSPSHIPLLNVLAWELATCPVDSVRDGREAVRLAERAVQLSGGQVPELLDTLGAAYAEAGRLPEAVTTAERAIELASSQGDGALVQALRDRVRRYRAGAAFRDPKSPLSRPAQDGSSLR